MITRFAPSPTGYLHIGGVRTALFNYLFTRKNKGTYLLRIDDTDKERSKNEFEQDIIAGFKLLGLNWDNKEIIRESERSSIYKKYLEKLLSEDKAYISKETPKEPGDREEVIRFRNPNSRVVIDDLIRGKVSVDTTDLGDFVIAKSVEEPIYHFASVVDDFEMKITHVIRAEEHLANTPRQILIQEAIGAPRPVYAHIPLILAPDRTKLSKRHGATSLTDYLKMGYHKDALINFLAFLGWNPGGEREIYSLDELVELFDITKVQKGGAIFNIEKLNWFNKEYISKLSDEEFDNSAKSFLPSWFANDPRYERARNIIREKISVFGEIPNIFENGDLAFLKETIDYNSDLLLWKKSPSREESKKHLSYIAKALSTVDQKDFSMEKIKGLIWDYADKAGKGNVLWPFRVAVTGQEKSPDPFVSAYILGKQTSLQRLEKAISDLS